MKKLYAVMVAILTVISGITLPSCGGEYGAPPGDWEYYADEDGETLDEDALLLTNIEDDVEEE